MRWFFVLNRGTPGVSGGCDGLGKGRSFWNGQGGQLDNELDARAANAYADIRYELEEKGMMIGPNDLIIAATAIASRDNCKGSVEQARR